MNLEYVKNYKPSKYFWGPKEEIPFVLQDNYQDYSKNEKIGKMADWMSSNDKRLKNTNQPGPSGIYAYIYDFDEENYTVVDNTRTARTNIQKNRRNNQRAKTFQKPRGGGNFQPRNNQSRLKKGANVRGRFWDRHYNANYWYRRPSIVVKESWNLLEEIEFQKLAKLRLATTPEATDIHVAGSVMAYDRAYDYIKPQQKRPLVPTKCVFHKVQTCDDPIIRNNISEANVFASDTIIATLMACNRSVAPWDIVIHRVANVLFLDKRSDSDLELQLVNETSSDPGFDQHMNSPASLSLEVTAAGQAYSQQALVRGSRKNLPNPNPFFESPSGLMPSVGYKYRVFQLDGDVRVMIRCEYDAYSPSENANVNIKTLLEYGSKPVMSNWRNDFNTLSGSILATEIKNNSNKFAKWTASAIICGGNLLKIGFVSRNSYNNNRNHSVVGSMQVASKDLVGQIGLNMENAWGILTALSQKFLQLPEGKYVLLKDTHRNILKLFSVPDCELDSSEDSDNEGRADQNTKDEQEHFGLKDIY